MVVSVLVYLWRLEWLAMLHTKPFMEAGTMAKIAQNPKGEDKQKKEDNLRNKV